MDARQFNEREQPAPGRHRWVGDVCTGWAVASGVAVIVLALVLPIVSGDTGQAGNQPDYSLYQANGPLVLLPAASPLLVALLVGVLLHAGRRGDRRWALPVAWALSGTLLCAAVVGFVTFLIGIFAMPTGILLVAATHLAQTTKTRRAAAHRTAPNPPTA